MKEIFLGLIGTAVAIAHGAMTVLYLSPPNLLSNQAIGVVKSYMQPLFYQDWHLFSPDPGFSTTQLWMRCGQDESWGPWFDPFSKLLEEHYATRVTGRGKLLYVYNGIGRGLYEAMGAQQKACGADEERCSEENLAVEVTETSHFDLASRFASDVCAALHIPARNADSFQIRVVDLTPKKFSQRNDPAPWGAVKAIDFPKRPILTTKDRKLTATAEKGDAP